MATAVFLRQRAGQVALSVAGRASGALFPPQCPLCGDAVAARGGLCGSCWRETPFLLGPVCTLCGGPILTADRHAAPDPGAATHALCNPCGAAGRPWEWGRAAMLYSGGARRLVLGLKHGDRLDLVPTLAGWMAARLGDLHLGDALLVPVPVHRWRLFARRYNQAAVLAHALAERTGANCCPDALIRVRATPPQKGRDDGLRRRNLAGAIAVHPMRMARVEGARVVLVDDVMTSGATLEACADALRVAGAAEIGVAVLARAARDDYILTDETREDTHDAPG